jgi:hypothetical protein
MEYKLTENDLEWRPRYTFNPDSRQWVESPNVKYHLIPDGSSTLIRTPDTIQPKLPNGAEWQRIQKCVMGCASAESRNWGPSDTRSWEEFFRNPTYPILLPFVTSTSYSTQLNVASNPPQISSNALQLTVCPEPLVCDSASTAAAWSHGRHQRPSTQQAVISPDTYPLLTPGDVVIVVPDDISRLNDFEAGYTVPISFGKVLSVGSESAVLSWLFCNSLDDKFSEWVANGKPVHDEISLSILQRRPDGSIVKVKFTKGRKLTSASRVVVDQLLAEIDDHQS